jgi:hypothetical protein
VKLLELSEMPSIISGMMLGAVTFFRAISPATNISKMIFGMSWVHLGICLLSVTLLAPDYATLE